MILWIANGAGAPSGLGPPRANAMDDAIEDTERDSY